SQDAAEGIAEVNRNIERTRQRHRADLHLGHKLTEGAELLGSKQTIDRSDFMLDGDGRNG
ncbi:MAG TPA: hypothetical protein DIU18_05050, partial [Gemmatimonadetes bacterium]|nr:hypothetical protein [Gemmatimonadota bacterium]